MGSFEQIADQRTGKSRRSLAIWGLVDEGCGYSMGNTDDWRQVTLYESYPLRCEACHTEGRPALQEVGLLCIDGPQVGRFLCDHHYGRLGGPLILDGPDPFRDEEENHAP